MSTICGCCQSRPNNSLPFIRIHLGMDLCALLLVLSCLIPATARAADPVAPDIRANVNEVQLEMVATDTAGQPVSNLAPADLKVLEDGSPVKPRHSRQRLRYIPSIEATTGAGVTVTASCSRLHWERAGETLPWRILATWRRCWGQSETSFDPVTSCITRHGRATLAMNSEASAYERTAAKTSKYKCKRHITFQWTPGLRSNNGQGLPVGGFRPYSLNLFPVI